VLGGGHCGLAMSRRLANRSIDHVVLERGEVANSWRTQRWDSLRLLTPNWMTRLPGYAYRGDDPDGYLTASETAQLIAENAKEIAAPVRANTTVISVRPADRGYVVQTDQDTWHARAVVSASGASAVPYVPHLHHAVPAGITTMAPTDYRNPGELPDGGVSSWALRRAEFRSPRSCTAQGVRSRSPSASTYACRVRIEAWTSCGGWTRRGCSTSGTTRSPTWSARRLPSMQLVGSPERKTLDLNALRRFGVRLVGRLAGIRDGLRNSPARWPTYPHWPI
jgi:putative flavoprotein involved in K+ transport